VIKCYECRQFRWAPPGHIPAKGLGLSGRYGFCMKHWKSTRADDVHFSTCPDQPTFDELRDKPETP
jgi:hypothetical protein